MEFMIVGILFALLGFSLAFPFALWVVSPAPWGKNPQPQRRKRPYPNRKA